MKNLFPLEDEDAKALLDTIIANKQKERRKRLNALKTYVHRRYGEYENKKKELSLINSTLPMSKTYTDDLLSCYGSNDKLAGVKNKIKKKQEGIPNECQYCMIGEPDTFDHYVPKDIHPEFSVLPINLLPCCDKCNRKKGRIWKIKGKRAILNFYYDKLPNKKFLFARVTFQNGGIESISVKFYFKKHPRISISTFRLIKSHFSKLELITRYERKANDKLIPEINTIVSSSHYLSEMAQKRILKDRIGAIKKQYGNNYWEAVLLDALLKSEIFSIVYDKRHIVSVLQSLILKKNTRSNVTV